MARVSYPAGMTAPVPPPEDDVFTVPYSAERANQSTSVSTGLGAATAVIATVLGVVFSGLVWWIALQDGSNAGLVVMAVVVTALMAVTVWFAWRPVRSGARNRSNLAQVRDALQISAAGIGFADLDRGGWIVVPWSMIIEARIMTWRTVRFLHIELSPELSAGGPGVQGLDDPATLRTLKRPAMGMVGPRFALTSLARSPEEIDAAMRRYSDGRVFLS